jgi:hypothetical protein
MSETEKDAAFGQQRLNTQNNEFNIQQFLMKQAIGKMNTATLVKVEAVHVPAGVSPVGFVDVTPLVNQLDGSNQAVPHTTVYGLPYARIQGGKNAVIVDPQVDDIGICVFAQADISTVKASKAAGNPGSKRRFDMADGMYIGGALNVAPERYVKIDDTGITIEGVATVTIHGNNTTINATSATVNADSLTANTSTTEIHASTATITASTTTVNGNFVVNGVTSLNGPLAQVSGSAGGGATMQGPLIVTNDVTAQGHSLATHTHGGVQTGGGNTTGPS